MKWQKLSVFIIHSRCDVTLFVEKKAHKNVYNYIQERMCCDVRSGLKSSVSVSLNVNNYFIQAMPVSNSLFR